jgi:hypothetical protein
VSPPVVGQPSDVFLPRKSFEDPDYVSAAAKVASRSLGIAGATLLASAVLLAMTNRWAMPAYLIALLAAAEIFVFARARRPTFVTSEVNTRRLLDFRGEDPGEFRALNQLNPNEAMASGFHDIWGTGPDVLARYAQFVAFANGADPDDALRHDRYMNWNHSPLFALLRLKRVIVADETGQISTGGPKTTMPRLNLMPNWQIIGERDRIFQRMARQDFDPRGLVILEDDPGIKPGKSQDPGAAKLIESGTDYLVVEAELTSPAVLLITDAYSRHWRATALPGSAQREYRLMPANYCLQAVPLQAGRHRIRIEYAPSAFRVGKWVSIASIIAYLAAWGWVLTQRRKQGLHVPSAAPKGKPAKG